MKNQKKVCLGYIFVLASLLPFGAWAVPSVKIGTAALIQPSAADTQYGNSTLSTNTTGAAGRPAELVELARALNNNVDAIYDFVRNNIDTTWMYGVQKGALGALVDRTGTPFDQAQLMVELLRQAGYTATYKAGTITLTPSEFSAWTGIADGIAACQLLSSGGIPAIVNGFTNTTCGSLSSTLTNVVLAHIWVEVTVPGSTCPSNVCQFDPSYKAYTVKSGRNLTSDAGLTAGQALTQATAGYTSAVDSGSGVGYVRSLNASALTTQLQQYAASLQAQINSNVSAGEPRDLVGGRTITRFDPPAGQPGLRQASIPFSPAVQRTWTGNIPDQYRTSLRVQVTRGNLSGSSLRTDRTLFADDIGGRQLIYDAWASFRVSGGNCTLPSVSTLILVNENGTSLELARYTEGMTSPACNPRYLNGVITLTVNHPYLAAANGTISLLGDYMDAESAKRVWYATPMIILHGFGDAGRGGIEKWSQVKERELQEIAPPGCETCTRDYATAAGYARRIQLAASWLTQSSVAAKLHAQIGGSNYAHHHSVGVVTGDTEIPFTRRLEDLGLYTYEYQVTENFDRIDVEIGYSVTNRTANTTNRRAVVHAIAATIDALEGSVVGQKGDLPDTVSTATRFDWANAPPTSEDPSGLGARRFYNFSSSNHSTAVNLVRNEGITTTSDDGLHGAGWVEIGVIEVNSRRAALSTAISLYAQAGFTVVASEDSFLGPGQRGGSFVPASVPPVYRHEFSKQRGGAFVATRYVSGEPVEIAHIAVSGASFGSVVSIKGGGGGIQPHHQSLYDPSTAADILKARYVDRSSALGVDMMNGAVTYASPASLSVGNGGFPYELSANLLWRNSADATPTFGPPNHVEPSHPWTTNWNNNLAISSSALEVMGESDVRAMAGTVAAFLAMQDVYKAAESTQREVAADMVAAWWLKQLHGNVVTASLGTDSRQFVRLTNGSWLAPGAGAFATLTQTGQRAILEEPPCGSVTYPAVRGWSYENVSFAVTRANGDVQNFAPWFARWHDGSSNLCAFQRGFRMANWTFPQGMAINFVYQAPGVGDLPDLVEVNNSLGRKIKFTYVGGVLTTIDNGLTGSDRRTIGISEEGALSPVTTTHTDPSGTATRFTRIMSNNRMLLTEVFDADDPTNVPSLRYSYDTLQRVQDARDAGALQGTDGRGPYQFLLANGVRAERIDPLGGRYTLHYNLDQRPMAIQDELARQTSIKYDGRGRVSEYIYPENDREQFEYDARNNVTKLTKVPKPCTPQPCTPPANIVAQASWNPTWNKPDYLIDARGFTTNFSYYPSGAGMSLLQNALRPGATGGAPIGTSTRPSYSFTYNGYGQILNTTDPTGLVSTNVYTGTVSNLLTTTIDPGGFASVTTLTYYANGDPQTLSDPRGKVAEFSYDNNRRKLVTKSHDGAVTAAVIAAARTTYDVVGQVRKEEGGTTFSGTSVTAWQTLTDVVYTPTGKVLSETNNAGNVTSYSYDFLDRTRIATDPELRRIANVYDSAGQTLCTWRGWNSTTAPSNCTFDPATFTPGDPFRYSQFTYSPNGLQSTVKDANNNLSTYEYDAFDRLARLRFPVTTKGSSQSSATDYEEYGYDKNGNRTSLRKRDTRTIFFGYDNLNRQTLKDVPGGTPADVYSGFDLAGRPQYARFGTAVGTGIDFGYDTAKRLNSETTFGQALTFNYDAANNRTQLTFPSGEYFVYEFDSLNRLTNIRENGATTGVGVLTTNAWDPLSRRQSITRSNGTQTGYGYDAASRLNSLTQDLTGSTRDLGRTFTHNGAGQIRTRNTTGTIYDWGAPLINKNHVADGLNRYQQVAGTPFSYDLNGNLTSDGARTFVYDVENRLTRVIKTGVQTDLSYDPIGRLRSTSTGSTVTQFLYEADRLVAEYNGAGTLQRRYVHGDGLNEPVVWYEGAGLADRRWLHADERGSIVAVSDGSGNGTEYKYGPYGEPSAWSGARFRYTGQIALPELELYHYKARVYDPNLGRFLQTDPIGYGDDLNLYCYVGGDSINGVDPNGQLLFLIPIVVIAYRAYSAYDTITSTVENVKVLADGKASTMDKALATVDLVSNIGCGKICGKGSDVLASIVRRGNNAPTGAAVDTAKSAARSPVNPGDTGTYGGLKAQKRAGGESEPLDMDHQPSLAAQKAAAEAQLGRPLTPAEVRSLRDGTPAVASPRGVHQQSSPTYGGRNSSTQIGGDAANLEAAAARDRAAFEEAMRNR